MWGRSSVLLQFVFLASVGVPGLPGGSFQLLGPLSVLGLDPPIVPFPHSTTGL